MLAGGHLLAYLLTIFVLIVIPGPSVLFVVSRGVALGRRAALATVVGNTAGLAVLVVVVSLGLGSIVARSIEVFTAIKLAGAAYMVFLGIRMLRDRRKLATMMDATIAPKGLSRMLREGFVVGVTNPKAMILLTAVLPQFVDPSKGHVQLQLARARGDLARRRPVLGRRVGDRLGYRARLARPLAAASRAHRRGRRPRADRARSAARHHRPQGLRRRP